MDNKLNMLINKLNELKNVSIKSTADTIEEIIKRYDMLFVGSKFNNIYSNELHHSLKTIHNIDISITELNDLIPTACRILNMKFEKLVGINDANHVVYQITLWE